MSHLREIFKNKDSKFVLNLTMAFALGLLLLLASNTLFKPKSMLPMVEELQPVADSEQIIEYQNDYATSLEQRLESVLSDVKNVGKLKVMVTLKNSKELVVAENNTYSEQSINESDDQGGMRQTNDLNTEGAKIILRAKDGTERPLIIKEIEPKVEGVIIVAEGGDKIEVQNALVKAAQTVLGIEAHKVQVLTLKK